jgi:hypothetical protein
MRLAGERIEVMPKRPGGWTSIRCCITQQCYGFVRNVDFIVKRSNLSRGVAEAAPQEVSVARLVSDIGIEQCKHTSLRRKAMHYRRMAAAIATNDAPTIATFPKYIPRGHPPDWYLARAEQYEQESATAGEMASLVYDMEHRNRLEASTPQDVWRHLAGDERFVGEPYHPALSEGTLDTLAFWVDYIGKDLPYTVAKLSTEQRQ